MSDTRPILIIDGLNAYLRAFCAYPTMSSTTGEQMGGCIGFLKTLRRLANELAPSAIYVAWESGGSGRRRALFNEYKLNRRPEKLNRYYDDDLPDTEENKKRQLMCLIKMLRCLPVCQLYTPDCEGDDVVAYLCRGKFPTQEKVIASSDKDMYQLLDENTRVYNLHKKIYITPSDVVNEFRVCSKNFAIAKALCGDPSDNIPGIKGMGFKTAAKALPFLALDHDMLLSEVIDYCESHSDENKMCKRIVENADIVRRNYRLVYLDGSMLSPPQVAQVDHTIESFVPRCKRFELMKILISEGLNDFDMQSLFSSLNCIETQES